MYRPAPQFRTQWTLEYSTTDQATLQAILQELTQRLTKALRQRGEGALECICRLVVSDAHPSEPGPSPSSVPAPLSLRIGLFRPTASTDHLCQLWQMHLQRFVLPAPVQQMILEATLTAPLQRRQRELFPDAIRHTSSQLAQLVDRLSSRLGQQQVVRPRLDADAQPELAFHYLPLTGNLGHHGQQGGERQKQRGKSRGRRNAPTFAASTATQSFAANRSFRPRGSRPLHLRSPPLPIAVVAVAPDGPPVRLLCNNRSYPITRYWGPERIETGWWRGHSVRRDYYRVETQAGHWFWLFRRLSDGHWFLHGMFG